MKCLICETDEAVEKHHIRPKSKGGRGQETIDCCSDCGGHIHMEFNNNDLALMGLEDLLSHEKMIKYIEWKKKHPGSHRHRMSKDVKSWKKYHR